MGFSANQKAGRNLIYLLSRRSSHGGKVCSTAKDKRMIVKYRDGSTWKDCF
jgi:hypothetical protein